MRPSTRASLILLAFFAAQAQAAPNVAQRQVAVQCPPSDKGGVALTSSEGADAGSPGLVTCTYGTTATGGAGPCTFFPANGSFSSGSSQCPAGIAQDPSATTDGLSLVGSTGPSTAAASNPFSDVAPPPAASSASASAAPSLLLPPPPPASNSAFAFPSASSPPPASSQGSAPSSTAPTPSSNGGSGGSASPSSPSSSPSPSGKGNTASRTHASLPQTLVILGALILGTCVL